MGQTFDLEMHIVHKIKGTDTPGAVLAIFFDRKHGSNQSNQFIDSLKFEETQLGQEIVVDKVNLSHLLSTIDYSKYWNYRGSLTTPPCTEGVKWTIVKKA
jgi:carbonic anhydrase